MELLREVLTSIRRLITDTARVWRRSIIGMLSWYLLGAVVFQVASLCGIWLGSHQHRNLAIGVFTIGVLVKVLAIVGMVRTCVPALFEWRSAATEIRAVERATGGDLSLDRSDPRMRGLTELFAATLLPLIAIYSSWQYLSNDESAFAVQYTLANGFGTDYVLQVTNGAWKSFVPAVVILLVVRYVIQFVDERWPSRFARLAEGWTEGFLLLLLGVLTPQLIQIIKNWTVERRFWVVLSHGWADVSAFFAKLKFPIPDWLAWAWHHLWSDVWPIVSNFMFEPLTWLAIVAVVFGYRSFSVQNLTTVRLRQRLERGDAPADDRSRLTVVARTAGNRIWGGWKDKFVPAFNALWLLIRVGPLYLGTFCLMYGLYQYAQSWAEAGITHLIGPRSPGTGYLIDQILNLVVGGMIFETIRIAFLSAGFDRSLEVRAQQLADQAAGTRERVATAGPAGPAGPARPAHAATGPTAAGVPNA